MWGPKERYRKHVAAYHKNKQKTVTSQRERERESGRHTYMGTKREVKKASQRTFTVVSQW